MREKRKKRTCIGEERTLNKIGLIISNIVTQTSDDQSFSLGAKGSASLEMYYCVTACEIKSDTPVHGFPPDHRKGNQ
jgi:hypothetical protein